MTVYRNGRTGKISVASGSRESNTQFKIGYEKAKCGERYELCTNNAQRSGYLAYESEQLRFEQAILMARLCREHGYKPSRRAALYLSSK